MNKFEILTDFFTQHHQDMWFDYKEYENLWEKYIFWKQIEKKYPEVIYTLIEEIKVLINLPDGELLKEMKEGVGRNAGGFYFETAREYRDLLTKAKNFFKEKLEKNIFPEASPAN